MPVYCLKPFNLKGYNQLSVSPHSYTLPVNRWIHAYESGKLSIDIWIKLMIYENVINYLITYVNSP